MNAGGDSAAFIEECIMKKNILGALVTGAVITGGETSSSPSVGDNFDAAVWQTTDGKEGMWNKWDFTANNGSFIFTHHMDGSDTIVGTFKYTLNGTTFTTNPAIPNSGNTYNITFNPAVTTFDVSPEPYDMGGTHFMKQ
jgi:hypothetical protein